jgi:hypothetical protein
MFTSSILLLLVGFASGYAVREAMSRRRRAAEKKRFHERHGW